MVADAEIIRRTSGPAESLKARHLLVFYALFAIPRKLSNQLNIHRLYLCHWNIIFWKECTNSLKYDIFDDSCFVIFAFASSVLF